MRSIQRLQWHKESNVKFYRKGISAKIPPDIKYAQEKHIAERFSGLKVMCFVFTLFDNLNKLGFN